MKIWPNCFPLCIALCLTISSAFAQTESATVDATLAKIGTNRGIVAFVGPQDANLPLEVAKKSELIVFIQTSDAKQADDLRAKAAETGLLGKRVFVEWGNFNTLRLGTNLADAVLASGVKTDSQIAEVNRILRPKAKAYLAEKTIVKPVSNGTDEWTHAYHGPDNNPQSNDQLVRGEFQTQFLGYPKFSPMPEQSVIGGGRIYKALGHIAHKENQNEMLNTLLCINAYNGTILWQRKLPEGFMIHRNTMIATQDGLLMGDHESCKVFDGDTGEILEQITVEKEITDGPVWKWMASRDGILYALVGNPEIQVDTQKSARRGLGHWPWGTWKGHDYKDPRTAFGFGRTLVAIDLKTKKRLWHYRDEEFLDARAVCMMDDQLFVYCPGKFLASIDTKNGKLLWRNTSKELLESISKNEKAQHYTTGYATTCYMKAAHDYLFFAGPQRKQLVAANAADGSLAWTYPVGNVQLVLRDNGVFAAGPQNSKGVRLEYATGKILAEFPARRACTRATGSVDSIFYRASGGTVRVLTETNQAQHIAPMRPPCQDGVLVSNGQLYWGPWMCGCQLSFYGNVSLSPKTSESAPPLTTAERHVLATNVEVEPLRLSPGDWPTYRGNNARSDTTTQAVPTAIEMRWEKEVTSGDLPTAPVTGGGLVFVADRTGAVRAFDQKGQLVWKSLAGGPIYYPPAVANDRVYVGSADGRVYAYEATTGRFLWSYHVAPKARLIPVFDRLVSSWPVSGGVVVQGDTVYAAAGIAHYDGTHVVALDAKTGSAKAHNDTSGVVTKEVNNGISMQGNIRIEDNELRFLAGGVYEWARYDLDTLECKNEPRVQVTSRYRTAFYPYYPSYGKYLSIDYTCEDGCRLNLDASYEGSLFTNLALETPLPEGAPKAYKEASRWVRRRGGTAPKAIWKDAKNRRFTGVLISGDTLIATGHPDDKPTETFIVAIDIKTGVDKWIHKIPAGTVKGGTAIDRDGNIYLSLENGKLICLGSKKTGKE
jgi:outer membrane protein assembly factor BamB